MLITFKTKSAADVTMYEVHAKRILELLNKDFKRGVITPAEIGNAIAILEGEIEQSKIHSGSGEARSSGEADHAEVDDDNSHQSSQAVSFATRVYPLLEMLRAAKKDGHTVAWGI
jgi:hypothetical protein